MSDGLAKAFNTHLMQHAQTNDVSSRRWFARGLRDFVTLDRPQTNCPVEMATAGFLYLSIDEDGKWHEDFDVLQATIAFLVGKTDRLCSKTQLRELGELLQHGEVDQGAVQDWFSRVYL